MVTGRYKAPLSNEAVVAVAASASPMMLSLVARILLEALGLPENGKLHLYECCQM